MVNSNRYDISTPDDIKLLVNKFYEKVNRDEFLSPLFAHVDWPHHLPIMYNFWSSVLLGDMSYRGNPLGKHLSLKIGKAHFTRWLELFTATLDEHFIGFNATEAKNRAQSIADLFQYKMGIQK